MARTRTHLARRLVSLLLALLMLASLAPAALAADTPSAEAAQAAQTLYDLGLFKGTGTNPDGTPIFALEKTPTRNQALIMLIRLLGKEDEALNGTWSIPFTDVSEGMTPYVGYAYTNGLTAGTTATTFGGTKTIKANQYVTFLLRALGYTSGQDFTVSQALDFSDSLCLTFGEYTPTSTFTRGDVAILSLKTLYQTLKGSSTTLAAQLNIPESKLPPTPQSMMTGDWYCLKTRDDGKEETYYHFEGNRYSYITNYHSADGTLQRGGCQTGTFTVVGNTLVMKHDEMYRRGKMFNYLDAHRTLTPGEEWRHEISILANDKVKISSFNCVRLPDGAAKFQSAWDEIMIPYHEQSDKYIYLAVNDYQRLKNRNIAVEGAAGYVYFFENAVGESCVLTIVSYWNTAGKVDSVITLHNLSTGQTIEDPNTYYERQLQNMTADIKYADLIMTCMKLGGEVAENIKLMLNAEVSILKGGPNTFDGVFLNSVGLNYPGIW